MASFSLSRLSASGSSLRVAVIGLSIGLLRDRERLRHLGAAPFHLGFGRKARPPRNAWRVERREREPRLDVPGRIENGNGREEDLPDAVCDGTQRQNAAGDEPPRDWVTASGRAAGK